MTALHNGRTAMIARNFRRFPEALALQLSLPFELAARRIRERHTAAEARPRPRPARLDLAQDREPDDFPIGSVVRLPTGKLARVVGYRGVRRGHAVRLVCKYLEPVNRRFDVVQVLPKLAAIVEVKEAA